MNSDFYTFITYLWHDRPSIIILFIGGLIVFTLLVIDTHRHRKKLKRRHKIHHHR